jgi:hypothetical protein
MQSSLSFRFSYPNFACIVFATQRTHNMNLQCHENFKIYTLSTPRIHSIVGIVTGYGLDNRGVGVQVPVGTRIFNSPHRPDRL